jgi:hypothetical protein
MAKDRDMGDNLNISGIRLGDTGEAYRKRSDSASFSSDSYQSPNSAGYEYKPRERKSTSSNLNREGSGGRADAEERELDPETEYLRKKAFNKLMFYMLMFALVGTVIYQAYYDFTAPTKVAPPPREMGPQKVVPLWLN